MIECVKNKKNIILYLFITMLIIKLIFMGIFSSEYQDELFFPFVNHFISNFDNPWDWVYRNKLSYEFPYHPLMLYILSIGAFLIKIFNINNIFFHNLVFKLPTLIADLGIYYLLLKTFKNKLFSILIFYFASPIILYASYMHSQLDLVPVAFLFLAIYYLKRNKCYQASIILGLTACTKMNVLLLLPILIIYIFKTTRKRNALYSFLLITFVYFIFSLPYLFSQGYEHLVLFNEKQNLLFNFNILLGNIKIYISLFIATLIYLRFFAYRKINNELLDSYVVLTISLFLLFVPPSTPAWFIWLIPVLNLFVIKYETSNRNIYKAYWLFNLVYLLYFVFFHVGDWGDLSILGIPINIKINNDFIQNCLFTLLEALLVGIIYCVYKIGIKSNSIYKKENALAIGIGGDSGSGKTTLLEDMQSLLNNNLIILEGDGDHKWERGDDHWNNVTHLNPKANYLHKQIADILKLKNMQHIYRSDYNHSTGKFDNPVKIEPQQFVVLAGLHPFYLPKMRKTLDFKIYLAPDEKLREYWKVIRDTELRGYSIDEVLQSMRSRMDDAEKYIKPQINFADLIINYFPIDSINFDSLKGNNIRLGLRLKMESSIYMDDVFTLLSENGVDMCWDYSDDLKTQEIIIKSDLSEFNWEQVSKDAIENIEEIVSQKAIFSKGYRGFIQFIILRIISEKMRDKNDKRNIN